MGLSDNKTNKNMYNKKCSFSATPLPWEQENCPEDASEERSVINTLLKFSENEEYFHQIINCQEWAEAVNGWKATVPNPKYITLSSTPQEEKSNKRQDKENKKERQNHRKGLNHELLWRNKIEPGTYRYNPRYNPDYAWKFKGHNTTRMYTNIQKRATDPQLVEHIERVREHLEKTLMKKDSSQVTKDVNKGETLQFNKTNIQDFISQLSEHNQKISDHMPVRVSQSLTDLKGLNDKSLVLQQTKIQPLQDAQPCHLNSDKVAKAGGDFNSKLEEPQLPFVTVISKKQMDINRDGVGDNNKVVSVNPLTCDIQEKKDNVVKRIKKTPERHSADNLPTANLACRSFEKFPAYTIPQQDLNPLKKLTPSMRRVSDNNEIIMVHLNGSRFDSSPSSAPPALSTAVERTPVSKESSQQYFTTVDAPNKNFIHSGISGKSVSPGNLRKLKGTSSRLVTKDTKPSRKTPTTPHRLASLGKPSDYAANSLHSLHRGAFERDAATAIASEILPGISGRKVGVPVLSHRVL
ncbi:uncharacterized protein [Antedon mediterranea]|uniref:uncharacterized protein n=1 Tax=Antedon mediterranea TaxID=105859 RepID=UPI003AF9A395